MFIRDKCTYNWYGRHVGDYPLPKGIARDQLGKCSHVIKIPGVNYEIGVVRLPDGKYTLAYDFYGYEGGEGHDGHKLLEKFGDKLGKLVQMYGVHKLTREAHRKGMQVQRMIDSKGYVHLKIA